jgi:hypothetical protein
MESDSFNGPAIFLVLAVITGVFGYLAVMQSKVKKQIEESRRERERADLATLGTTFIPAPPIVPPDVTPTIEPGAITDITPSSLPKITPGGTPPPDTGGHPHSTPPTPDSGGTWSGGSGFDTGGDAGGGHHGGHH